MWLVNTRQHFSDAFQMVDYRTCPLFDLVSCRLFCVHSLPLCPPHSPLPRFLWHLGNFGKFGISASLVVQLRDILSEPTVHWKYELLYVPFLIPFALASLITVLVHRKDLEVPWYTPFKEAFQRVAGEAQTGGGRHRKPMGQRECTVVE